MITIAAFLALQAGCDQPIAAQPQKPEAGSAAPPVRVTAGKPQRKTLQKYTSQPARIQAFEETPLHSKLDGYVDKVLVDIGERVKKDQVLATLWVPELKDQVTQKDALLAQAVAEVSQAAATVRASEAAAATAEARVSEMQAGITRSDGEYQRWKAESARMNDLAASGSVTRKVAEETLNQFRAADSARQEAAARVDSAKAASNESKANIENSQADLAAARARQRVAESNLAQSKTMLAYAEIRAPYDGVVTRRNIDTRHFVRPPNSNGSPPLLVVCQADVVRLFVDVPELEAALVDLGDKATVQLQALPGTEIEGHVTRTSWDLDPTNRSLRVEIDLPNESGRLRPGMYATANVLLDEKKDVLTIPAAAVVREGKATFCCTVDANTVHRQAIKLGLRVGADVEVTSGLTGNETVVLLRADSLKENQAVEVLPADVPK